MHSHAWHMGTSARAHTQTHIHTVSHTRKSEVGLLIDRVIERFKIHLPSTVRQTLLSLEFNRLGQSSSWSSWEDIFDIKVQALLIVI